jgi:hypothetical protein
MSALVSAHILTPHHYSLLLLAAQVDAASSRLNDRLMPRLKELTSSGAGGEELQELR